MLCDLLILGRSEEKNKEVIVNCSIWKTLNRVNLMGGKKWRDRKLYSLRKESIGCISPPWSQIQFLAHTAVWLYIYVTGFILIFTCGCFVNWFHLGKQFL